MFSNTGLPTKDDTFRPTKIALNLTILRSNVVFWLKFRLFTTLQNDFENRKLIFKLHETKSVKEKFEEIRRVVSCVSSFVGNPVQCT